MKSFSENVPVFAQVNYNRAMVNILLFLFAARRGPIRTVLLQIPTLIFTQTGCFRL